ncbi:MAG: glutamine-hydrolyzing carbamoyl-phosphate synthase small subunit [Acidimicrobiales bacterium]|nr:glutamine-hydrolyzing carbamoyl-phosphate synthase small subunit [Acidimicrobiales bacterium]
MTAAIGDRGVAIGRTPTAAALVLADGSVFEGELIGASPPGGIAAGEVVFNTAHSGYQEIITDPSYAGQIITFTYPHIGNYGTNANDAESRGVFSRGVIVRELSRRASNYRNEQGIQSFLETQGLPGLSGIDTRRLTRLIRTTGTVVGAFGAVEGPDAQSLEQLAAAADREPGTDGVDLVATVTTPRAYTIGNGAFRVVALDFGMKTSIGQQLAQFATVEVVPAATPAAEVLAMNPDGVFLSNGPGDPGTVPYATQTIKQLLGEVPVFGICLGHQLLSTAIGGTIVKLPFGHHGANHPVRDETTGKVEITSQNHNFAVDAQSIGGRAHVTHVNLNDGVCEGIRVDGAPAFSVQHHPEASPGPHDSRYLFQRFQDLMAERGN